jgi:hypothetical protein
LIYQSKAVPYVQEGLAGEGERIGNRDGKKGADWTGAD